MAPALLGEHNIAAVSYLNTRPLLEGLENIPQVHVTRRVPSEMRDALASQAVEAALLPVIDLQRCEDELTVVPAGCISSAGTILTVRIFSQVPPQQIQTLWVDSDSHTSVALAQVLWHFQFRRRLRVIPFTAGRWDVAEDAQAVLMIGDKVVAHPPIGFNYQYDLGRMWWEMTGLPFTFATWVGSDGANLDELYRVLSAARRDGQENLEEIALRYADSIGWPQDLAVRYLTSYLQFEFTQAHREGMEEFFEMAAEAGIIPELRKVRFYGM
jgi:chorismate dehydratase